MDRLKSLMPNINMSETKEDDAVLFKGIETNIQPTWYDEDAIRPQPYIVGRVPISDESRTYYRIFGDAPEDWSVRFYASLTTALFFTMPTPAALKDWYMDLGKWESKRVMKTAQHYGTMLHILIGEYSRSKIFNFSKVSDYISNYCSDNDFFEPECRFEWPIKLQEDMAAWIQFTQDVALKVIAVELCLVSEEFRIGTAIDIVADAYIEEVGPTGELLKSGPNKGEPKMGKIPTKRRILINMKSGRKGIFETHVVQMAFEKAIFEENYPDIKIDRIYNWAPNDWRTENPSYKFVDQTDKITKEELSAIASLTDIRFTSKLYEKQKIGIFGEHLEGNSLQGKNIRVELLPDKLKRLRLKKSTPQLYKEGEE